MAMSLFSSLAALLVVATATTTTNLVHDESPSQISTKTASVSCPNGTVPDIDFTQPQTIVSSGNERQFLVHLPDSYDPTQVTGLILSFHGYGGDMWTQQEISRFNDSRFNPDMIAVFPQGLDGTQGESAWEGVPRANPSANDKVFTTDILTWMRAQFCIDNRKIYASGKSDGGGFVGTLACSPGHGGDFAAFAAASGAFYTDASNISSCHPARSPTPILEFHGSLDCTIPYVGGVRHNASLPSIPSWLNRWATSPTRNGCVIPLQPLNVSSDGGQIWHATYTCGGPPLVEGYYVEGMGHVWPSTELNDDNRREYSCPDGTTIPAGTLAPIEATTIMMNFFIANPMPL